MDYLEDIKDIANSVPYGEFGLFLTNYGGSTTKVEGTVSKTLKVEDKDFEDSAKLILQMVKDSLTQNPDGTLTFTVQNKKGKVAVIGKVEQVRKTYQV